MLILYPTKRFLTALTITALVASLPVLARALDTAARAALVYDHKTDTVILSKNPDMPVPPASMSKLMTLNMLFEALQDGRVTLDTKFSVSANAAAKGGSKMFLRDGERVAVRDLIQGIIVQSGNDACIVVAENLAGSEADFARLMTRRAKKLGMENSTFANATGWPDPNQRMSAADLVLLAQRLQTEFPEFYGYFAQESFTWDDITQENRNPLLGVGLGVDGLKTGHTSEAGYGLVASAIQGDRRVTFMITGLGSQAERAREGERLLAWAYRQFTVKTLIKKDTPVAQAQVWLGRQDRVDLVSDQDLEALIPYNEADELILTVEYDGPIEAPITKGDQLARLVITVPGLEQTQYPLYAARDVAKGGVLKRLRTTVGVLSGAPAIDR